MRSLVLPRGVDPLAFGRRPRAKPAVEAVAAPASDVRLFLWTFASGFVFMSVYLA